MCCVLALGCLALLLCARTRINLKEVLHELAHGDHVRRATNKDNLIDTLPRRQILLAPLRT